MAAHRLQLWLLAAALAHAAAVSTVGREMVLVFLANEVDFPRYIAPVVYLANSKYNGNAVATISVLSPPPGCVANQTVGIAGGSVVSVTLCSGVRWSILDAEFAVANKIIRVTATQPLSVWGMNEETQSAGTFLALPTATLGTYYYVVTYGASAGNAEFGIVSISNNTLLNITWPSMAAGASVPVETSFRCLRYASGSIVTFTMQAMQVYMARSTRDLTGTKILTSKAVAVFAGNARTSFAGERGKDHVVEQLISVGSWDTSAVVLPTPARPSGVPDVVRVVASVDGTTVCLTTAAGSLFFVLPSAGAYLDQPVTGVTRINATNPISVTLITGDQAMITVPGLSQYTNDYYAPIYYNTFAGGNYPLTYLMVVAGNDSLSTLRLNGDIAAFQPVQWQRVPNSSNLVAAVVPLSSASASMSLENLNPSVKVGAYHYGTGNLQAFGTVLALDLPKRCEFSLQVIGDGIDNDCNGLVDDQICSPGVPKVDCGFAPVTSYGKDFVLIFETNNVDDSPAAQTYLAIAVTPMSTASITMVCLMSPLYVSGPFSLSQNFSVLPAKTLTINIPSYYLLSPDSTPTGAYTIRVLASQDVAVAVLSRITGSTDSYLAFPTSSLGYDYYIVTYYPGEDMCQFAVVAAEAGATQLQITMPNPAPAISVQLGGSECTNGQVCTAQLNQYQSLQVQTTADLTGARVLSRNGKKIAVFSGNIRARVVSPVSRSRDHLVDEVPPVPTWGRQFVVIASPRFDGIGDYIRVVACRPNTHIFVDQSDTGPAVEYVIPAAGGYVQIDVPWRRSVRISSTNPVLAAQFTLASLAVGDPSMTIVPAVEQWLTSYKLSVFGSSVLGSSYTNYVSLAIATQLVAGLLLNGSRLSASYPGLGWTSIPNTQYSTAYLNVTSSSASIFLSHSNSTVTFLAVQYGAGARESYGNIAGSNLTGQPCVQNVAYMVPGDAVDNDCDNTVDEETLNGIDDDFDGLVDEDCGPVVVVAVSSEPKYRFWIAFMQNDAEEYRGYPLEIHVASSTDGNSVRLRLPVPLVTKKCDDTVSLNADDVVKFDLSNLYRLSGTSVSSYRTVLVETNKQASVFAFNKETYTSGAFNVFREDGLGLNYYVVCSRPQDLYCQFAVVSTADQTLLTISLPACSAPPCTAVLFTFNRNNYTAGSTFTVPLNMYQALQVSSSSDLTGTGITSNNPVAVFSGDDRTSVGPSKSRDHMVEQLPPVTEWGTEYLLVSAPGRLNGDLYRIVASTNGTTVQWLNTTYNLSSGGYVEVPMSSNSTARVTSNNPVMIALITRSADVTAISRIGDPAMLVVPSTANYLAHVTFSLPAAATDVAYTNYLVLVAPAATPSDLTRLMLNGQYQSSSLTWQFVSGSDADPYWATSLVLDPALVAGNSAITVIDATGDMFYAFVVGNGDRESYAFNAGDYFTPA